MAAGYTLANIPGLISEVGRVKGFEALRDLILNFRPEEVLLPWDKIVKMVLEVDRHALAAMVMEAKASTEVKGKEEYEWFQTYLRGEVEIDTNPATQTGPLKEDASGGAEAEETA